LLLKELSSRIDPHKGRYCHINEHIRRRLANHHLSRNPLCVCSFRVKGALDPELLSFGS